ncbi:histone deacetylase family protein [Pseudochryseolinea flava]|uniref:Histone deacetylase n=1 Tax=Pseudochryseolinea flava TaxID=2059302 RepID=A0A364XWB6_9BACT|nr:histone deacetylase [Pseudochryseolinea flava]RAV98014.1 histone deacetylase [Pseudochryseolinea flava]
MLKIAWCSQYVLPLPIGHRFPMSKYEILPLQLIHEGTINEGNLFTPSSLDELLILAVHHATYWNQLSTLTLEPRAVRRTGFPLSQKLVDRECVIASGTIACADYALQFGIAMNIAGGTHHAFTDHGEGFCLLNDIAIAAQYLLSNAKAKQILIIDLDVHQGNGTAEIFKYEPRVFTFSMHGANNYPLKKESSDLDVGLPDHTSDATYLHTLAFHLDQTMTALKPDFIFFQSGVDILDTDQLGRLKVSREGCKKRDRMVLQMARENKIPIVVTMGGGYSKNFIDIIEAHANTFRVAQEIYF